MPTILNAANEIVVEAYIAGAIEFYDISEIVERVCSTFSGRRILTPASVAEALAIDQEVRATTRKLIPAPVETAQAR